MVRDDDPVGAVRERARGVLARHDALYEHFHRRRVLELVDVVPGEARDRHAHAFQVDAVEHVLRFVRADETCFVARLAERVVLAIEARARLEIARRQCPP